MRSSLRSLIFSTVVCMVAQFRPFFDYLPDMIDFLQAIPAISYCVEHMMAIETLAHDHEFEKRPACFRLLHTHRWIPFFTVRADRRLDFNFEHRISGELFERVHAALQETLGFSVNHFRPCPALVDSDARCSISWN